MALGEGLGSWDLQGSRVALALGIRYAFSSGAMGSSDGTAVMTDTNGLS